MLVVQSNIFPRMVSWKVGKVTWVSRLGWNSWWYVRKQVFSFNSLACISDFAWTLWNMGTFSQMVKREISFDREGSMTYSVLSLYNACLLHTQVFGRECFAVFHWPVTLCSVSFVLCDWKLSGWCLEEVVEKKIRCFS